MPALHRGVLQRMVWSHPLLPLLPDAVHSGRISGPLRHGRPRRICDPGLLRKARRRGKRLPTGDSAPIAGNNPASTSRRAEPTADPRQRRTRIFYVLATTKTGDGGEAASARRGSRHPRGVPAATVLPVAKMERALPSADCVQPAPDGRPGPNLAQASSGAARPSARTVSFPPPDYGGGDPRPALLPPAGWCAATRSGTSSTASARSSSRSHGPRPRLTRTSTTRGAVPVASFSVRRRTPARGNSAPRARRRHPWLDLPEAAAMAPV